MSELLRRSLHFELLRSARNVESELVLATNRHSVEVSWKMENAAGNLTRAEADHLG